MTQPVTDRTAAVARRRRADIQWLRALAVLSVVVFHAGGAGIAPGGFVGVDVFFVISGYLILRGVGQELDRNHHFDARAFLARRVMRILPMLLLVIVLTALASWLILGPIDAWTALQDLQSAALHYANVHLAAAPSGYFAADQTSPALHLWSISVEEQFYFSVVLLGLFMRTTTAKPWIAVIAGIVIVSFVLSATDGSEQAYYWPWTRAWELGVGALLGLTTRGRVRPYPALLRHGGRAVGVGMILVAVILYDASVRFPGWAALLPVLGAALAILAGNGSDEQPSGGGSGAIARLTSPGLVLGDVSYSLYLWHWPVLVLSAAALGRSTIGGSSAIVAALASVVLAVLSYHLIERPLMTSPVRKTQPSLVIAYGVAAFLVVAALLALMWSSIRTSGSDAPEPSGSVTAPPRTDWVVSVPADAVPADLTPSLTEASSAPVYDGDCLGVMNLTDKPVCWAGDTGSERDVILFGDSHAAHFVPALDTIGKERGMRVMPMVLNACPSLLIPVDHLPDGTANPYCDKWREHQLEILADSDPEVIILSNQTHLYEDLTADPDADPAQLLEEGLSGLLDRLPQGVPVVLMSDSITWPETPVNCLAEHLDDATACSLPRDHEPLYTAASYAEFVGGRENVRVVDTLDLTCADQCYALTDSLLIYQDTDHFSQAFVKWLTPALEGAIFGK
ncbi:acyltransferase family protein [Ornithinimicrobium avium]|uniref:acyltransferase family protein n=1 Tax=Ornithinimicrobium avium TaxID=2283195 RepID=UPI0013B45658|nr:acyltransferase family protein [Ornithinimicrobium avium]